MMIVRNEIDRYLDPVVTQLLTFCDEIRVTDDGSTDGTRDWLEATDRVHVRAVEETEFYRHEGRARQAAMQWAYKGSPTHVLAVDADEYIAGGDLLREALATDRMMVWTLDMQEIWQVRPEGLMVREDGGWRAHPVPICYRYVRVVGNQRGWQIPPRALASGRVPLNVARNGRRMPSGAQCLHLGWACEADRDARYQRYVEHDSGRFHRSTHLESIMWPDDKVRLRARGWPDDMDPDTRARILDRANRRQT